MMGDLYAEISDEDDDEAGRPGTDSHGNDLAGDNPFEAQLKKEAQQMKLRQDGANGAGADQGSANKNLDDIKVTGYKIAGAFRGFFA